MSGELVVVGNYAVAGTNKFVSHALRQTKPDWVTYCGLHLKYHKNQQWEETDGKEIGCLKCQKAVKSTEKASRE